MDTNNADLVLTSLGDYAAAAAQLMNPMAAAYFLGGAAEEITLTQNRRVFERIGLVPRVLTGKSGGSTALTLLGRDLAHPVILAPVAFQRLAHPDGESGTAQAAAALDALMVLSCQSSEPLEAPANVGRTCRWFQIYMQPARAATLALVRRAEAAGYEAIVVTVDAPLSGVRNREMRAGFQLPDGISAINLHGLPNPPAPPLPPGGSAVFDQFMTQAPNWGDIAWLRGETRLKLVLKGILHPDDARRAVDIGADGLILSNHGGRVLDGAMPAVTQLPSISTAIEGRVPLLVDGGIRRGTDVLKALALGASAVLIGRPIVEALSVKGAHGVAHVLRLLRDELEITMALCGCNRLSDITPALLRDVDALPSLNY
ncbi:alpha-hydroxy acid oxidase [Puniceibacterium sp. IMCC21224]|uniref:alpha-hydroxy acid oxidase n=1 Tax=Puniceibacterium sp. IMCC21224 TaxID=1618204 RepID=UPI00064DD0CF|nr:alpha-hydroxy acid oxidase [Puniceibacterium sp. IMCC21224]KMK67004.1 alpha-hydroxyacid dehydrogenase, FMN-dependent L-lactate dehydrogenase [Puniceibacterium sp. IMCC21224]